MDDTVTGIVQRDVYITSIESYYRLHGEAHYTHGPSKSPLTKTACLTNPDLAQGEIDYW